MTDPLSLIPVPAQGEDADRARQTLREPAERERIARLLWAGSPLERAAFGEMLEGLEFVTDPAPPYRDVTVRTSNGLRNAGLVTWADLALATPARLRTLPNLGAKSFVEIFDMVLAAWAASTDLPTRPLAHTVVTATEPPSAPRPANPIAPETASALADVLRWLWAHNGARTLGDAFDDADAPALLDPPQEIATRIRELAASEIADMLDLRVFASEDWRWLLDFDARERLVLQRRSFAVEKMTLDQLAKLDDVTRERIRQVENRALEHLDARLLETRALGLKHLAARLRREAAGLVAPDRFDDLLGALLDESEAPAHLRELCAGVLQRVSGPWPFWGAHLAAPALIRRIEETSDRWHAAGPLEPIPTDEFESLMDALGVDDADTELLDELGVQRLDDVIVLWGRSQGDRAAATLVAAGRVLRFQEIHAALGASVSPRSLQNAILADHRLMRRGKETFGLRSWGGEEYTGLFDELEQAIERAGGQVVLKDIVDRFVEDFGVKAGSVLSYAADRRFIKHADGTLAMRTAADPEVHFAHIPIEETAGAYRIDGVWHLCVEVDHDVARGSGRQLRRGIGQEAGLEPDLTFAVTYDGGPITFTWPGTQPQLGSVRGLMEHHGCVEGDLLMLPLAGAEPRRTQVVRGAERNSWNGVARIAAEMGLDPTEIEEDEQPLEVADAVGLPPGADWYDIADRIRDRRDHRVAAFLPEHLR